VQRRLRQKLQSMLGHLGMHREHLLDHSIYLHKGMPIGATAHQAGTVRFGDDSASSALDPNCKAHEVDNLYVVGHQLLPEHRGGESLADGHRECPSGRRRHRGTAALRQARTRRRQQ